MKTIEWKEMKYGPDNRFVAWYCLLHNQLQLIIVKHYYDNRYMCILSFQDEAYMEKLENNEIQPHIFCNNTIAFMTNEETIQINKSKTLNEAKEYCKRFIINLGKAIQPYMEEKI